MSESEHKKTRGQAFVQWAVTKCMEDPATAAAMRKAASVNQEFRCWPFLVAFGVDINKPWERLPYVLIGSSIALTKVQTNGEMPFMAALAKIYDNGQDKSTDKQGPGEARLRRVLSCDSVEECCRVLRPVVGLVLSQSSLPVDLAGLLDDLLHFNFMQRDVKASWATDYYRKGVKQ